MIPEFYLNKKDYAEWLASKPCQYWMTYTYREAVVSFEYVERCLKKFHQTLRRRAFGKHALRHSQFNQNKCLSMAAMIEEHKDGCLHVHALLTAPPEYLKPKADFSMEDSLILEWRKISKSSDDVMMKIAMRQVVKDKAEYMLKTLNHYPERFHMFCWDSK